MTENEQKQQMSVAYVHAIAARAGYACQVKVPDEESVDVTISASGLVHGTSILRSPRLDLQLKASSRLQLAQEYISFPLPRKNYDDLRGESLVPKLLVVLLLPKDQAELLDVDEERMIVRRSAYWKSLAADPPTGNATKVSVRLPRSQRFDVDQLCELMTRVSCKESV